MCFCVCGSVSGTAFGWYKGTVSVVSKIYLYIIRGHSLTRIDSKMVVEVVVCESAVECWG